MNAASKAWPRHLKDTQEDTLPELTTQEALADYRASKKEQCRISKA